MVTTASPSQQGVDIMRILLIFLSLIGAKAPAETVYLGSGTETIEIRSGHPTVFRFHSPVRTITHVGSFSIRPANESDPDYSVHIVKPKISKGSRDVVFILSDQSIYKIRLKVVSKNSRAADVIYDFKDISDLSHKESVSPQSETTPIEIMKASMTKSWISGHQRRRIASEYTDFGNYEMRLVEIIEGPIYKGLAYRVRNKSDKSIRLRQEFIQLGAPYKPVLSHISRKRISPKGHRKSTAIVRVVAISRGKKRPEQIPFGFHDLKDKK